MMVRGPDVTRYRESDAAPTLGASPGRPQGPGSGLRLQGLERCGRVRHSRPVVPRHGARRPALRDHRPRGVRRLPGDPSHGAPAGRSDAPHRLAGVRGLRGPDPARAARPDPALRPRARDPLAHVLPDRRRPLRGARRADGDLARRAAGRRPALPPRLRHRHRLRRGARRPHRPHRLELRGPDRDRRRASRPPQPTPGSPPPRCGPPSPTTSPSSRTRRARSRSCASSSRWSA